MFPLLKGALLGFSIAAPVGPIGLLCIHQSMTNGRKAGLACGLGAATADAFYGAIAGFGVTGVSRLVLQLQTPLRLFGGVFLLYLGLMTFRQEPANAAARASLSRHPARLFLSTCLLTLANPMTILSFGAVFAGLGLGSELAEISGALWLVAGVFLGSALWWCVLSGLVGWLGSGLSSTRLTLVNQLSGIIIIAFGVWQLTAFMASRFLR